MIPIERHQRILALVEQRGAVSINELTEILGVSHMTALLQIVGGDKLIIPFC